MTLADQLIRFYCQLSPDWKLPRGFELIYPFGDQEVLRITSAFYRKYFSDNRGRVALFGINPGRFGAGVTGVPFTDPITMKEVCGIDNPFKSRFELSSVFIYDMINAYGGPDAFYRDFLISSLCPLGFIKDGKNINYYDDPKLQKRVEKYIRQSITYHITAGCRTDVAYSLGKGKNFKYFNKLNEKYGYFERVLPLPHPRWVMQYKLKKKDEFRDEIIETLKTNL